MIDHIHFEMDILGKIFKSGLRSFLPVILLITSSRICELFFTFWYFKYNFVI